MQRFLAVVLPGGDLHDDAEFPLTGIDARRFGLFDNMQAVGIGIKGVQAESLFQLLLHGVFVFNGFNIQLPAHGVDLFLR